MDANGWKAVLVYGDASEHSALAYFTNFVPRLRWGMALIPREGEPRLLASMSSRDVPAMKLMTFIPDVLSGWNWDTAFDPWLAKLTGDDPMDIGTVGFDLMRPPQFRLLEKSLGNRFRLREGDAAVAACRTTRSRQLSQVRAASPVLTAAAEAFVAAWRNGTDVEGAALAAERTARLMAAQDVRTLVSFDGGRTLAPFRGVFEAKSDPLVGYLAVKHAGVWADIFVTAASRASDVQRRVQAALDAMLAAAGPGARASTLHAKAVAQLGALPLHAVLSDSVGRRIGFSLDEGGALTHEADHALAPGEVYTLHVGAHNPASGGALRLRRDRDHCDRRRPAAPLAGVGPAMSILRDLAAFVCGASAQSLSEADRATQRRHVADTLIAAVAGSRTSEGRALRALLPHAALIDAIGMQAAVIRHTEIDDIHTRSCTTPSSVTVPTALVLARDRGIHDPNEVASAIWVGTELLTRLGVAINGATVLYRGVWPTYFAAPLAAAAIAARLWRLSVEETAHALSLALMLSAGRSGRFQGKIPGRSVILSIAVTAGLRAAAAAHEGVGGDPDLLDGPWLRDAHGLDAGLDALTALARQPQRLFGADTQAVLLGQAGDRRDRRIDDRCSTRASRPTRSKRYACACRRPMRA